MPELQLLIFTVIAFALLFDFINGFHDTANAIATSVSTRALKPQTAIIMAAFLNFAGAMYSTGVAKTIGGDIVSSASLINEHVIIAALSGSVIWNLFTWWIALPSSSSHALVGGVIGAVLVSVGSVGLNFYGIGKIVISLIASPILAIVTGFCVMHILFFFFGKSAPSLLNWRFKKMQILSAAAMAFSHGSNDAQKSMGIITLALITGGVSGSIMGVGTAKRLRAVHWGVAQQMVVAWVLTIPCTAIMGALIYKFIMYLTSIGVL